MFNDPSRIENLRQALACFAQQEWPYKEAVIVNDTSINLRLCMPRFEESMRVLRIKAKYLGELKNIALYNALGEWCFPWPDDCNFAPGYIGFHMQRRSKSSPTVISNPLGSVIKDEIVHALDWEAATFASFFRFGPYIYDADGSEVRFLNKYPDKNLVQAESGLATRFFSDYAS